ncbi:MAG: hypothetical protein WA159_05310 [Variovorax sp.]
MYTVRNARRSPTVADWFVANTNMVCGLVLWAAAMVAAVAVSDLHGSKFFMSLVAADNAVERAPADASTLSP